MSPPGSPHRYAPSAWYLGLTAALCVGILVVVHLLVFEITGPVFVAAPIGCVVGGRYAATMQLSPDGVTASRRTFAWTDLRLHKGRLGESLRKTARGLPRVNFLLKIYEWNWREGRIGDDLRRWAPQLLAPDA